MSKLFKEINLATVVNGNVELKSEDPDFCSNYLSLASNITANQEDSGDQSGQTSKAVLQNQGFLLENVTCFRILTNQMTVVSGGEHVFDIELSDHKLLWSTYYISYICY